jgi:hypothetical protein
MGVVLWYQVKFPDLGTKISGDVYSGDYLDDAEITVDYAIGQPGRFDVHFKNLPLRVNQALADVLGAKSGLPGGVKIVISLGYLDDPTSQRTVLSGRVDAMQASTRFPPLGSRLTGYEEAAYVLLNTVDLNGEGDKAKLAHVTKKQSAPPEVVKFVLGQAGVGVAGDVTPEKCSAANPKRDITEEAENAFNLLDKLAGTFGAELLVQDGKAQFGAAVLHPPRSKLPEPPPSPSAILSLLTGEDVLIAVKGLDNARLAEFQPLRVGSTSKQRVVTDLPKQADVNCFDFTTLGVPGFRAGQAVIASVDGYENPFKPFRILQITHAFSPDSGYVCKGRAVAYSEDGGNREMSDKARGASALAIADRIAGKIKEASVNFPSVGVGKVKAVKSADRVASLFYRQDRDSGVAAPSVDLDVPDGESVLLGKPLAAPFAWHKVGLTVPVYPGMRALTNQVRDARDDTVVTGFLWANQPPMDRPKAKDGDWWLCLPTELAGGPPPVPDGKGANDLVAADGRRVVEVAGLKIVVGKDVCTAVGERPTEGAADVLLISHKSGTTVQIDADGNVNVEGKGKSVVLKCGGATLTVGDGKVSIS